MKNHLAFFAHILVFLCSLNTSYGQRLKEITRFDTHHYNHDFCGTDLKHKKMMGTDAQYKTRHQKALSVIQKVSSQKSVLANGIAQIPVVVHVMHKGETIGSGTNISDENIKLGIKYLNNYWRKVSGSNGDGDGVDMQIEFALAIQDESGNCTNGINRVDMSSVTDYANEGVKFGSSGTGLEDYDSQGGINSLKEYSIWDPTKYYNVWLVDEINDVNCTSGGSFTAGYAYYASAHGQAYDGSVVLICSFLNEDSSIWAHEMGHAFNLPHTFDGDDSDNDGVGDQCGDDGITDTPSHIRTIDIEDGSGDSIYFDCNNSDANTCDATFNEIINPDTGFTRNSGTHQDHMHNYMDYTGCPTEFTGGQRAVAIAALNGTRSSFLSSPALTPAATANVAFTSSSSTACLGSSITFTDTSTCTPNSYTNNGYDNISFLWNFDNGVDTPYTSTEQNPTIIFNNDGTYNVSLSVTNVHGTTNLTQPNYIVVSNGVVSGCSFGSLNSDGNFGIGVTNVSFNTLSNVTSTFIPSGATQDFSCSYNTTLSEGASYNLNVTYSSINSRSQFLEVWIDWDNNGSFETSNSNGDNEMVLTDNVPDNSAGSHAVSGNVTPPSNTVVNQLLRMRVVSEADGAPSICGTGFAQRADDYGVYVSATLSQNEQSLRSSFNIYPNPVRDYLNISLNRGDSSINEMEVYDISGKLVVTKLLASNDVINVSQLKSGLYFLKVKTDVSDSIQKFVKL